MTDSGTPSQSTPAEWPQSWRFLAVNASASREFFEHITPYLSMDFITKEDTRLVGNFHGELLPGDPTILAWVARGPYEELPQTQNLTLTLMVGKGSSPSFLGLCQPEGRVLDSSRVNTTATLVAEPANHTSCRFVLTVDDAGPWDIVWTAWYTRGDLNAGFQSLSTSMGGSGVVHAPKV